ncbi:MAG TPA: hypothetical protein VMC09_16990, partial [Anaerolineales bacterium]|nr:hypothetical protein [Anaerolineales bacterium]
VNHCKSNSDSSRELLFSPKSGIIKMFVGARYQAESQRPAASTPTGDPLGFNRLSNLSSGKYREREFLHFLWGAH